MTRRLPASRVGRDAASSCLNKARGFHADARKIFELGDFSGNGIAVIVVHAAIAYADALCIKSKGQKSKSGDHRDAADFLRGCVRVHSSEDRRALRVLESLLSKKDQVSYADDVVRETDARSMGQKLDVFAAWSEARYRDLP